MAGLFVRFFGTFFVRHRQHRDADGVRGAVYILVPALVVALLAMVGLVVDGIMAMASQEQQLHACEYAAIGALDAFLDADVDSDFPPEAQYEIRLGAAIERANEIVALNGMLSNKNTAAYQADRSFAELALDKSSVGEESLPGPGGLLTPGRWRYETSVCNAQGEGVPCFVPAQLGENRATAFKCQAQLDSPIQTLLARFFGQEEVFITAEAVSANTPRHIVFSIDLTPSLTRQTHLSSPPAITPALSFESAPGLSNCSNYTVASRPGVVADYVYDMRKLQQDQAEWANGWQNIAHYNSWWTYFTLAIDPLTEIDTNNTICQEYQPAWLFDVDEPLILKPAVRPGPSAPTEHYRSDYRLYKFVTPDETDLSCPDYPAAIPVTPIVHPSADLFGSNQPGYHRRCYLVDMYRYNEALYSSGELGVSNCTAYDWCEPDGAFPQYVEAFSYEGPQPFGVLLEGLELAIANIAERANGDDLVGMIPFDSEVFDIREENPLRSFGLGAPSLLLNVVDSDEPLSQVEGGFIPRNGQHTDIRLGLFKALTEHQNHVTAAKRSVILISDGLANCANWFDGQDCLNDEQHQKDAFEQLHSSQDNAILPQYEAENIRIDVLKLAHQDQWFPADPGPHTFNYLSEGYKECCVENGENPNSAEHCASCTEVPRWMDDIEAVNIAQSDEDFNFAGYPASASGYNDWKGATWSMWLVAKKTGGRFLPIRPAAPASTCNTPTGETTCADFQWGQCVTRAETNPPQMQKLDPYCRTPEQQIIDYLEELSFSSEIRLVK